MFSAFLNIFKRNKVKIKEPASARSYEDLVTVIDFSGDNHLETSLDLAKAYIEMSEKDKAKRLLKSVIMEGSPAQISEARAMFALLLKSERGS